LTAPSFTFLAFAFACALAFNLSSAVWWRQLVLLLANVYFLQTFTTNWQQLVPYAGFLVVGYLAAAMRSKGALWSAWVFPLAILAVFVWLKRYLFVPSELLLPKGYLTVGLSFVFFRVMYLVIDGWENMPKGARGLVTYLNYTLNFTSLISGPIQRFEDYQKFEKGDLPLGAFEIGRAIERIVVGFFKVYILSATLASIQAGEIEALSPSQPWSTRLVEGAVIAGIYPVYLYFNFSGYTDFVIGVARFFRIELPENFNRPFLAGNIIEFWNRWHMSLTLWLKTYVYSPLLITLLRRFPSPKVELFLGVIAYFVTFFLVGFWHGQTSEFLFFGILQGAGVAANKLYQILLARRMGRGAYAKLCRNTIYVTFTRSLTFTWYAFTLLWFWSSWENLRDFASVLGWVGAAAAWLVVYIGVAIILSGLEWLTHRVLALKIGGTTVVLSRYTRTAWTTAMTVVILVVSAVLSAPAPQIVYKAF
jgi:D-alanyl-lipoteichoic acid acyltransferase DltB (MBOAT superfamily)